MITYNNLPLVVPGPALQAWIAVNIPTQFVYEFEKPQWPGLRRSKWAFAAPRHPERPIRVGTLYWPRAASRWGIGHFILQEKHAAAVSALTDAKQLRMTDGTNEINVDMWALPLRPLSQFATVAQELSGCYLLTLVDKRYYWWWTAGTIDVDEGVTTWQNSMLCATSLAAAVLALS